MKIALRIQPTHDWTSSVTLAREWTREWQNQGHDIVAVLFFGEAVHAINDPNCHQLWQDWQQGPLLVCSTLVEDRHIDAGDDHPFQVAGLGLWESKSSEADRLVVIS